MCVCVRGRGGVHTNCIDCLDRTNVLQGMLARNMCVCRGGRAAGRSHPPLAHPFPAPLCGSVPTPPLRHMPPPPHPHSPPPPPLLPRASPLSPSSRPWGCWPRAPHCPRRTRTSCGSSRSCGRTTGTPSRSSTQVGSLQRMEGHWEGRGISLQYADVHCGEGVSMHA